jgi:hypothetical protein
MHPSRNKRLFLIERTRGDFPHVRRREVQVACCTTTTCCLTLLVGGVGLVAGLIAGSVAAINARPVVRDDQLTATLLGIAKVLVIVAGYALGGLLVGAAIGFGLDSVMTL